MDTKKPKSSIFSEDEQVVNRLHYQWQIIRRHTKYVEFCEKYETSFDDDDFPMLDTSNPAVGKAAKGIKDLFGLETIYKHTVDIPEDLILKCPVFNQNMAAEPELHSVEVEQSRSGDWISANPIWEGHKIKVIIDPRRTDKEIMDSVADCVRWARSILGLEKSGKKRQRIRYDKNDHFRIWDLYKQGRTPVEIIREIWPDEYKDAMAKSDFETDRIFKERRKHYESEGCSDSEAYELAYKETYAGDNENAEASPRSKF